MDARLVLLHLCILLELLGATLVAILGVIRFVRRHVEVDGRGAIWVQSAIDLRVI